MLTNDRDHVEEVYNLDTVKEEPLEQDDVPLNPDKGLSLQEAYAEIGGFGKFSFLSLY